MHRRPPRTTPLETPFPDTTLFRSGRIHRYRRNEDGQLKCTMHGHDYRGAGGRLSSVIRTVPDLPHFDCRPERTSLSAGLAGSAGPATASPTFFPGSVPSPSSRGKTPGFGRPVRKSVV